MEKKRNIVKICYRRTKNKQESEQLKKRVKLPQCSAVCFEAQVEF